MVKKLLGFALLIGILQGCASIVPPNGLDATNCVDKFACVEGPEVVEMPTHEELRKLPSPEKPVIVAVYKYLSLIHI